MDNGTTVERQQLRNALRTLTPESVTILQSISEVMQKDPTKYMELARSIGTLSEASQGLLLLSRHSDVLLEIAEEYKQAKRNGERLRRRARDIALIGGVAGSILAVLALMDRVIKL